MSRIILLVEEDATLAELIRDILHQDPGCVVLWARDCAKALDLLQQDLQPHHILLDLAFPYATGLAFHDQLQRDSGTAAIPFLILTVQPTASAITARNFAAVLPKPFDLIAFEAMMSLPGPPPEAAAGASPDRRAGASGAGDPAWRHDLVGDDPAFSDPGFSLRRGLSPMQHDGL